MKNCFTCALATDHGETIKCRFKPRKLLEQFPFYPVFAVRAHTTPVQKSKIPAADCPAYKDPKPTSKTKGP